MSLFNNVPTMSNAAEVWVTPDPAHMYVDRLKAFKALGCNDLQAGYCLLAEAFHDYQKFSRYRLIEVRVQTTLDGLELNYVFSDGDAALHVAAPLHQVRQVIADYDTQKASDKQNT